MKHLLFYALTILLLAGCAKSEDEKAQGLLNKIESLYKSGKYSETLDSITILRDHYPRAIDARTKALKIWQDASLKMAQEDVAKTDIRLQEVSAKIESATNRGERNLLCVKRDSLKARYEAMCGVVRMIHMRQKQK